MENTPIKKPVKKTEQAGRVTPVRKSPAGARPAQGKRPAASGTAPARPRPAGQVPPKKRGSARRPVKRRRQSPLERAIRRYVLQPWTLAALLLIGIALVMNADANSEKVYERFKVMRAEVDHDYFYDGITVDGVDVSGMTLEQAEEHFEKDIEPKYKSAEVTLDNGTSYTAAELGYQSDYVDVLETAFGAGRSGTLEERYAVLEQQKKENTDYTVTRVLYDEAKIEEYVAEIANRIDIEAVDSKVDSFNVSDWTFTFTQEVRGQKLDTEKLIADIETALDAGGGSASLKIDTVEPEYTADAAVSEYGMITSAVTNASESTKARLSNLRLACSLLNGVEVAAGATFSYNDVIGERTLERGFLEAPAYSDGTVITEVGGGICQLSTTLFNAAVKADMRIVERHNHSLPASYVDAGKDAAVNWRSRDFRFKNTSGDTVFIRAYVTGEKRVVVEIYGRLLKNGEYITVEAETTEEVPFECTTTLNPDSTSKHGKVIQEGKNGCKAVAYKVRWSADGTEISRSKLCDSYYHAVDEITEVSPVMLEEEEEG